MDQAGARARLARMTAAGTRPVLDTATLDQLLEDHRTVDGVGRLVTDPYWTPTWDLNAAAAEGWRAKAAAVAADFTFTADDGSYNKGEVMAKMLAMADTYAAKGYGVLGAGADRLHPPYDATRLIL